LEIEGVKKLGEAQPVAVGQCLFVKYDSKSSLAHLCIGYGLLLLALAGPPDDPDADANRVK
jgi:hypothetical protein